MTFGSALTLDIPRARKVLEHLIAHPEEHDQYTYGRRTACGTTMCIAGSTVYQDAVAGSQIHWKIIYPHSEEDEHMIGADHSVGWVYKKAAELLGLNSNDAEKLFFEFRDREALDRLADWIKEAERVQAVV